MNRQAINTLGAVAPAAQIGGFALAELRAWTVLLAGLAYWGNVVRTGSHAGGTVVGEVARSVLANGAFNVAAWGLIGVWITRSGPAGRASPRQIAAALAVGLLCVIPTGQATILALIVLAVALARVRGTRFNRPVAILLLALAVEMAWTSTYFLPLHAAIATVDGHVVQGLLSLFGGGASARGNLVRAAGAGFDVEILAFCASSYPLAGVGLAFVVTTLVQGRAPRRGDLPWFAASILASIMLTELRLAWMATGETRFSWIHDGNGAVLYTLAALALAVLFPMLATRNPPLRARA